MTPDPFRTHLVPQEPRRRLDDPSAVVARFTVVDLRAALKDARADVVLPTGTGVPTVRRMAVLLVAPRCVHTRACAPVVVAGRILPAVTLGESRRAEGESEQRHENCFLEHFLPFSV